MIVLIKIMFLVNVCINNHVVDGVNGSKRNEFECMTVREFSCQYLQNSVTILVGGSGNW